MYPNLSEDEKSVVREFMKIYERDIGYHEPLLGNKEGDDNGWGENFFPNAVFIIYHMRSVEPNHPNHRLPQYKKVISKMSPNRVQILDDLIRSMNSRRGWKTMEVDRKKKSTKSKSKRKICRCKK